MYKIKTLQVEGFNNIEKKLQEFFLGNPVKIISVSHSLLEIKNEGRGTTNNFYNVLIIYQV